MSYFGHTCKLPSMERPMGPCPACEYDLNMAAIAPLPDDASEYAKAFAKECDDFAAKIRASTIITGDDMNVRINARDDDPPAADSRDTEGQHAREPIKVDQRPNGCWAACVATITGIPLDELCQGIPAEASEEWFWEHATDLHNDMILKLRARNWRLEYVWRDAPRGFAIASGQSPRLATVKHAVVVKDGELWHDPHPSRDGLLVVESFEILIPFVYTFGPDDQRPLASRQERDV